MNGICKIPLFTHERWVISLAVDDAGAFTHVSVSDDSGYPGWILYHKLLTRGRREALKRGLVVKYKQELTTYGKAMMKLLQ